MADATNTNKRVTWNEQDFPQHEKPEGVKFFNINSGETRVAETEAMVSALYNSGNLHINATKGQDFGWRLAPETIKQIQTIRDNQQQMLTIAAKFSLPPDEVKDTDILTWISYSIQKRKQEERDREEQDFTRKYEDEVRAALDGDEDEEEVEQTDEEKAADAARRKAAKAARKKQEKDAKRREENIAAGRDLNDGIKQ